MMKHTNETEHHIMDGVFLKIWTSSDSD